MAATKKNLRITANLTRSDGQIVVTVDPTENVGLSVHTGAEAEIDLGDETRIVRLGQFLGNEIRFGAAVAMFGYDY